MKMVEIKKICCFQLHSFAMIWGWIGTTVSGLVVLAGIIVLANSETIARNIAGYSHVDDAQFCLEMSVGLGTFVMVVSMITSIGLIVGVLKENHKYLLPWIFHESIACGLQVIAWVILFFGCLGAGFEYSSQADNDRYGMDGYHYYRQDSSIFFALLFSLIFGGLFLAVRIYIFIGIYSLFKNLRRGKLQDYEMLLEQNDQKY